MIFTNQIESEHFQFFLNVAVRMTVFYKNPLKHLILRICITF